jgi:hypothetical protein
MNREEFGRHYHYLIFKNACNERKGAAFQTFFEQIMGKCDKSFIAVKPSGREGDWKCDGFSQSLGIVYQCYAPEGMKHSKAAKKVEEDFSGAKTFWTDEMLRWIFVWSAYDALPPQVLKALQKLRSGGHGVTIGDWNRETLWSFVKSLSEEIRTELLMAAVPEPSVVPDTTPAEITVLLAFIASKELTHNTTDLDLTEIAEKLKRNRLSESVKALLTPAIPVARLVEDYLNRHPDSEYSARIAQALTNEYRRIIIPGTVDPDDVFLKLVRYATSKDTAGSTKSFWAGIGIITYYFQLCDIFER